MKKENQITIEERIEQLSKWELELILLRLIDVDKHINVGSKTRREIMTSKNKTFNITVSDNESNLYDMGFEADYLIDELVELTYQTGTVWRYSEEAHKDYIREKMSIGEILDECNDLGVDLSEYEIDSDE